jgi:nicotinamidase/pyrazinamidase
MNLSDLLFWNVDTQIDFVSPEGKLYVKGAELLKFRWKKITLMAKQNSIRVVNTADFHLENSVELSVNPDFIKTFPPHCMANTEGAEYIEETQPEDPFIIEWNKKLGKRIEIKNRNIIIQKDAFDVFKGNANTDFVLKILNPTKVYVYGVTTNVCVNDAVVGLAKRVKEVYVVEDAIKELPNIPLPFAAWKKLGVKMIQLNELETLFGRK